jgi:hypothetical protein
MKLHESESSLRTLKHRLDDENAATAALFMDPLDREAIMNLAVGC